MTSGKHAKQEVGDYDLTAIAAMATTRTQPLHRGYWVSCLLLCKCWATVGPKAHERSTHELIEGGGEGAAHSLPLSP